MVDFFSIRAFIPERSQNLDNICLVFCGMVRTAYNLLLEEKTSAYIAAVLRDRYGVTNRRWCDSAINEARGILASRKQIIQQRIWLYREKIKNTESNLKRVSSDVRGRKLRMKLLELRKSLNEQEQRVSSSSHLPVVFGSKRLLAKLAASNPETEEHLRLRAIWRNRRSNHFSSVGQANQKGNANTRLIFDCEENFRLQIRNWLGGDDFAVDVKVPNGYREVLRSVIQRAESVTHGTRDGSSGRRIGLPYSVRVIKCDHGYQMTIALRQDAPTIHVLHNVTIAGIDINPEGIACTIVSRDGNLIATRFFKDNRLISASKGKRKWVLENMVNKMIRWCKESHGVDAVVTEHLNLNGAYDFGPTTNMKLSNFMRRRMLNVIRRRALRLGLVHAEVNPAYTSLVGAVKYGRLYGGFNTHQLAAFVIARRALGYGESPTKMNGSAKGKEKRMWDYSRRRDGYHSQLRTLLGHEPMEWKSGRDDNDGEMVTKLLTARSTETSVARLSHVPSVKSCTEVRQPSQASYRQVESVHPNPRAREGDGTRGHRVNPPFIYDECDRPSVKDITETQREVELPGWRSLVKGVPPKRELWLTRGQFTPLWKEWMNPHLEIVRLDSP